MKKMICLVLALAITGSLTFANALAPAAGFDDVPASHWAYESITDAAGKDYVNGVGDGKFNPEGTITYAEFVSMLTRAFYADHISSASGASWYTPYTTAARSVNILAGTNIAGSDANAAQTISRYEMAQLMSNIMAQKDKAASGSERSAAQSRISDWNSIPANYQNAVSACYALSLITGYSDGSFSGGDTMTRAQACVVLVRMDEYLNNGTASATTAPAATTTPEPVSGTLANGKPITEENVLEILAEIEKEYPDGMIWGDHTTPGTAYYKEGGGADVDAVIVNKHWANTQYGCGGFAAMVSDRIFGRSGYPMREVTDKTQTRAGDIIIALNADGTTRHVMVAISDATLDTVFEMLPDYSVVELESWGVKIAQGNTSSKVSWGGSISIQNTGYVVYTRYPD